VSRDHFDSSRYVRKVERVGLVPETPCRFGRWLDCRDGKLGSAIMCGSIALNSRPQWEKAPAAVRSVHDRPFFVAQGTT
jgi:hypothetical protein